MRHRRPCRGLCVATVAWGLAGCADWPRWSHLPEEGDGTEAPEDPRELVEREWVPITEVGDLPDAWVGSIPVALDFEQAGVVSGSLDGAGWNDLATPRIVTAPGCNDTGAARQPGEIPGDWIGDVDVFGITAPDGGTLCAEVAFEDSEIGWDLLLAQLDPCGIPESFAEDGDVPLGWDRGGDHGRWDAPLEPGVAYGVTLAAYWPTDLERSVPYRLGLSLVPSDGDALCPLLPEAP